MTVINAVAREAVGLIGRAVIDARTPTPTDASDSSSTTSSAPAATSSTKSSGGGGAANSPLLFFVALGFGVVFTNLWIIVGVKYCFRYNARNRQRQAAEMGDPIVMDNMPRRRRKREKKLMTMDEVNERFPMTKYKMWMASRASEGLPTAGGISTPPSRAASVVGAEGVVPASPVDKQFDEDRPATALSEHDANPAATGSEQKKEEDVSEKPMENTLQQTRTHDDHYDPKNPDADDEEDDDQIDTTVPAELLNSQGDTCAICLDVIEQDDDIRGLTCGHAFHAVCLDPWLTNRRACCPLCKADYYIPKPRTEEEIQNAERAGRRAASGRPNMPQQPPSAWTGIRGNPRLVLPGRFIGHQSASDSRNRASRTRPTNTRRQSSRTTQTNANSSSNEAHRSWMPSFNRSWVPNLRLSRSSNGAAAGQPSPGQLEAGTR